MPEPDRPVRVIAHRGASAYAAEHTFAAYDLALEMGADVLELDIRPTAEGDLVVVHDVTLERTAQDPRAVGDLRAADLLGIDAAVRPLALDAVLARYGDATQYLIELKDPDPAMEDRLLGLLARVDLDDQVTVQSFDHGSMRRLHAADEELPLIALYRRATPAEELWAGLDDAAGFAVGIGPLAASVDAALVRAAHARGLAVQPYTVNDEEEAQRLLRNGVDGLITDAPDRIRASVGARDALLVAA